MYIYVHRLEDKGKGKTRINVAKRLARSDDQSCHGTREIIDATHQLL